MITVDPTRRFGSSGPVELLPGGDAQTSMWKSTIYQLPSNRMNAQAPDQAYRELARAREWIRKRKFELARALLISISEWYPNTAAATAAAQLLKQMPK